MTVNFENKIKSQLSQDVQNVLLGCSEVAEEFNFELFLIGGIVRDLFLGKQIFDIDIIVAGNAIEFCHKLTERKNCKIIRVQDDLKTAKVIFDNGIEIDVASTRQEFYPKRGHMPVVTKIGCTLEEDVYRRDFTINSLAVSLNQRNFGELVDYVDGLNDLKNRKLRILHDNSFLDDPSRIIRGLKFAARFDLSRDENTRKLQEKYQNEQINRDVSWSRLKSEIKQTFSLNSAKVFDMFLANGISKIFYANQNNLKGLEIKTIVDKYKPEHVWLVYLGVLLFDKDIIESFCFTRAEKKIFVDRDDLLNSNLCLLNSNYDIYKFFNKKSAEAIIIYYLLTRRKEALIYLENLSQIRVELRGEDLIQLGVKEGKKIGQILDGILKKKLSGSIVNREDEEIFVKKQIK